MQILQLWRKLSVGVEDEVIGGQWIEDNDSVTYQAKF